MKVLSVLSNLILVKRHKGSIVHVKTPFFCGKDSLPFESYRDFDRTELMSLVNEDSLNNTYLSQNYKHKQLVRESSRIGLQRNYRSR